MKRALLAVGGALSVAAAGLAVPALANAQGHQYQGGNGQNGVTTQQRVQSGTCDQTQQRDRLHTQDQLQTQDQTRQHLRIHQS